LLPLTPQGLKPGLLFKNAAGLKPCRFKASNQSRLHNTRVSPSLRTDMPEITSPFNKALVLCGVTAAGQPKLVGSIVHEHEGRVVLPVDSAAAVNVYTRIVRSNMTGLLHFHYRLAVVDKDYDSGLRMVVSFGMLGVNVSFADFRVDGPGTLPPNYFESTPTEPVIFRFDYGLSVGRDSRFCFVSTNAREFRESGGTMKLFCSNKKSVGLEIPGPIGLAAVIPKPVVEVQEAVPEGEGKGVEETAEAQRTQSYATAFLA
jgi:hypothetical protein